MKPAQARNEGAATAVASLVRTDAVPKFQK
jgi:hypothetical protein